PPAARASPRRPIPRAETPSPPRGKPHPSPPRAGSLPGRDPALGGEVRALSPRAGWSLRRADHQRPRTPPPPTAESRIPPGRDPAANEQRPRTPPPPTAESRIPPGRDPALGGGAVRVWNGAVPAS